MKVTIKDPRASYSIDHVKPGDFFHYANGKDTKTVFVALATSQSGFNTVLRIRNLNTGNLQSIYTNTNKQRVITFVEPIEIIVQEVGIVPERGEDEAIRDD